MFGGSNPACTTKHLGFIYLKKCLLLSSQYWKEIKIQASGWKFPLEAIKTQLQAPRGKYLWEFRYRLPDEAELIGRRKLLVTRMLLVVFVKWLKYHKVPWEIGLLKMPWPRNHCPKGMRCLSKKAWVSKKCWQGWWLNESCMKMEHLSSVCSEKDIKLFLCTFRI